MLKTKTRGLMLFIAILATVIVGCDSSSNSRSIDALKQLIEAQKESERRALSIEEIEQIFQDEGSSFKLLVSFCLDYPILERVRLEAGLDRYYGETPTTAEMQSILVTIKEHLVEISALSLHCGRRQDFEDRPLAVVSFTMNASGLSVSGQITNVFYLTDWSYEHDQPGELEIAKRNYYFLGERGWYIDES